MQYLLEKGDIQLMPFDSDKWRLLAKWAYDKRYREMFRHMPQCLTEEQLKNYPQLVGGDVFFVVKKDVPEPIGYVVLSRSSKTNRACKIGILIDEDYQRQACAASALYLALDYIFNFLGFRKGVIKILSSNVRLGQYLGNAGFLYEGTQYGEAYLDGEYVDEERWSVFADFFNKTYKERV